MTNIILSGSNNVAMPTVSETTAVSNANFLDWEKDKTQALTLDMLARTHRENDVYGNPLRGIYHFQLIETVLDMAKEIGYDVEVYDLFAAQNRDKTMPGVVKLPQVEAQYGKNAVEAHILRRVYANVRIKDFDDAETTTNLAIAFHQKGIQVGFGPNVKICHNQCMLSAQRYIASYGDKGTGRGGGADIETILRTVREWLENAKTFIDADREKIARMKATEVSADQMLMIIGTLTAMRVKADTSRKSIRECITYPLNQAQITTFTEDMLEAYTRGGKVTAWDIYDSATNLYKANRMDIPQLLPQNRAMVGFLDNWFQF
jgi:hypothetical protein